MLANDSFWRGVLTFIVFHYYSSCYRLDEGPSLPRIITPDGQILLREDQRNGNQEAVQQEPEEMEAYNREIEHQEVLREDTPQEVEQQEGVQQEEVQREDVEPDDVQGEEVQVEDVEEETIQAKDPLASDTNKEPSMIQLKRAMKSLWNPQTKHSSRGHAWMIAHRERSRLAFGYFETDSRND